MCPIACVIDIGSGPKFAQAGVLDLIWLGSIRQHDRLEIQRASDTKLKVSETITFHFRISKWHARVTFGVVNKSVISVLLETTFIDRYINSV